MGCVCVGVGGLVSSVEMTSLCVPVAKRFKVCNSKIHALILFSWVVLSGGGR